MQTKKIRPGRLTLGVIIGTATFYLLFWIFLNALHQYRIWQADGIWCIYQTDSGEITIRYGDKNCPSDLELEADIL